MIEANAAQSSQGSAQSSQGRVERRMRCSRGAKGGRIRSAATWRVHCGSPSAWSLRSSSACSTSRSARSTEAQAPRQSGISLEKEKRSVDPRGVATASGGASILCSWLVAREAFAGLSVARRSPPARGRERLTKDVGLEMLDRRAATAETRKASVKAIGKGERLWGVLERQRRPGSPTSWIKA